MPKIIKLLKIHRFFFLSVEGDEVEEMREKELKWLVKAEQPQVQMTAEYIDWPLCVTVDLTWPYKRELYIQVPMDWRKTKSIFQLHPYMTKAYQFPSGIRKREQWRREKDCKIAESRISEEMAGKILQVLNFSVCKLRGREGLDGKIYMYLKTSKTV